MKQALLLLFFWLLSGSLLSQSQLLEKTITVDGVERSYLLYVPAAYDGSEAWPLILNLHGYQANAQFQLFTTGMNAVADTAHFLVAYPQGEIVNTGLVIEGGDSGPGWNLGGLISDNDDVAFLSQVIDLISTEYSVDDRRVYAAGFSLGGGMVYVLGCELSDRLAAIASVSGTQTINEGDISVPCNPTSPMPVLHIHGTSDLIDPFDGNPLGLSAYASTEFWINQNNCAADSMVMDFPNIDMTDQSTVTSIQYNQCDAESEVWLYRIDGGGHTWPGGPAEQIPAGLDPFFGNINLDINASSEIWNFFNRHELSESTSIETVTPAAFGLNVFPNPASAQVTFRFTLPQQARVQLTLHNAIGQHVQSLLDGQLPQGEQRFAWRSDDLPTGTYFYRLRVNDQVVSRPIIVKR